MELILSMRSDEMDENTEMLAHLLLLCVRKLGGAVTFEAREFAGNGTIPLMSTFLDEDGSVTITVQDQRVDS